MRCAACLNGPEFIGMKVRMLKTMVSRLGPGVGGAQGPYRQVRTPVLPSLTQVLVRTAEDI